MEKMSLALFLFLQTAANAHGNTAPSADLQSTLPAAPKGFEWQLIGNMSDEFDGTSLNRKKWNDNAKSWRGRPPAEFLAQNVAVKDGSLQLKTSTHPAPNEVFSIAGAAASGKHPQTFGYFEARIKASNTKMSTTFWLHSDEWENANGPCETRHKIELDILEAIGGWPKPEWANVMHSNTHYKKTRQIDGECKGEGSLSKGNKFDTGAKLADAFHTYASWWVTANKFHFYFDGKAVGTVELEHEHALFAFDGPMTLRMVAETYDWQAKYIPAGQAHFPTGEELDNRAINTAYYDYIRSYRLVPAATNLVKNPGFESKKRKQHWRLSGTKSAYVKDAYTQGRGLKVIDGSAKQKVSVKKNSGYVLSSYGKNLLNGKGATIAIEDSSGRVLQSKKIDDSHYQTLEINFNSGNNKTVFIVISDNSGSGSIIDNVSLESGRP